jgi:hypothetical protein
MRPVSARRFVRFFIELVILVALTLTVVALLSAAQAQAKQKTAQAVPATAQIEQPLYSDYRGVRLGMSVMEARAVLGAPKDSNDQQDFFVFSEAESAQVFYDKHRTVWAVSVNYLGETSGAPAPEKIFGAAVEVKPDGSIYKMVRYIQAGYFVAYSRSGGDEQTLVTIIMQRILD